MCEHFFCIKLYGYLKIIQCTFRISQKSYINKVESKFDIKYNKFWDISIIKRGYQVSITITLKKNPIIWKEKNSIFLCFGCGNFIIDFIYRYMENW